MYDLIGDIHGHADELVELLEALGYRESHGVYGKAIHHILRRVAEIAKAKKKPLTAADIEKVFSEGFYLPFAHKFAFGQDKRGQVHLIA